MRLKTLVRMPFIIALLLFGLSFQPAFASGILRWNSLNWAGYVAEAGLYTSVTGTWVVPTISPEVAPHGDGQWVGIGGMSGSDLIQAGTQTYTDNGTTSYFAWYEILPEFSVTVPLTVNPGDTITTTISEEASDQWNIMIRNVTTGQMYQQNVTYHSSHSSAEWVEEMLSNTDRTYRPLANFGSVEFTNDYATQNGSLLSLGQTATRLFYLVDSSHQQIAAPSDIGQDGTSFSVSRVGNIAQTVTRMQMQTPATPQAQIVPEPEVAPFPNTIPPPMNTPPVMQAPAPEASIHIPHTATQAVNVYTYTVPTTEVQPATPRIPVMQEAAAPHVSVTKVVPKKLIAKKPVKKVAKKVLLKATSVKKIAPIMFAPVLLVKKITR